MRLSNVTMSSLLPLLSMIPVQILVMEEEDWKRGDSGSCCCKKEKRCNRHDSWNLRKKCDSLWNAEDEGICLGRKDFYQTNDGDINFNAWNDWGEPSPVRNRTWDELAEQEGNPQPDGIDIHVDRPTRDMFRSQRAFASAKAKYAQLEDIAHSINWPSKEPMKGIEEPKKMDWDLDLYW